MKIIAGGRAVGKTTKLIIMCAKAGPSALLVCHNHYACTQAMQMAEQMGVDIRFPITYGELLESKRHLGMRIEKIYIDNLEMFMKYATGGRSVEAMTVFGATFETIGPR